MLDLIAPARAVDLRIPVNATNAIIQAGRRLDARGWVPATAGNISQRLDDDRIAITRSGVHKGFLGAEDVILVTPGGAAFDPAIRPSAETLLHCQIYTAFPRAGAVVHGHSVASTVLSRRHAAPALRFAGYEVQKVFEGQSTHDAALDLPLVDNDQDIARLARAVAPLLPGMRLGYLIRGHGTYVWGPDMPTAMARFEALEFLLACALAEMGVPA
jgi:methylthioribulose-1-phosphate dehydratase